MFSSEIERIEFGISSTEEIRKQSVVQITSTKYDGPNSVYDKRLGVTEPDEHCPTCLETNKTCTGHFGHIELNTIILHPILHRRILIYLKCFCWNCSMLILKKNTLKAHNALKGFGMIRIKKILKLVEKTDICQHCKKIQPRFCYVNNEEKFYAFYKNMKIDKLCIDAIVINNVFNNICDEQVSLLGIDPKRAHPKNLILTVLPVLPPRSRPCIITDGRSSDDDLTIKYLEILKAISNLSKDTLSENVRQKHQNALIFHIKTMMDNSKGKAKHLGGRLISSLKDRIDGKIGQVRENLMGKRVDYSGRTVIGPDPTLKVDEIGISLNIANILTKPVRINQFNISSMTKLVNSGGANSVSRPDGNTMNQFDMSYALQNRSTKVNYGDIIIRNGNRIKVLVQNFKLKKGDKIVSFDENNNEIYTDVVIHEKKHFKLQIGDIVNRKLKDGDFVLLNRQPTLHKGSMMGQKIKIMNQGKTIRLNLAVTGSFNADFDGDEMNIHVPQTEDANAELIEIMSTKKNLMSAQSNRSNVSIVQDSLLGSYLMSKEWNVIDKAMFYQLALSVSSDSSFILNKMEYVRSVLKKLGKDPELLLTTKGLLSIILPENLIYEKRNDIIPDEPCIKIYRGVLYEGCFSKSILGKSHGSLLQILNKEFGNEICINFINNIQFLTNAYLRIRGFTVGISDCIIHSTKDIEKNVHDTIVQCKGYEQIHMNARIKELRINAALNKAKDIGYKIAKNNLSEFNNLKAMIIAGSKGDYVNIAQITSIVGQQNIVGGRIPMSNNHGRRTLPHYKLTKPETHKDFELLYQSRGFIMSSFMQGLDPREFFFHASSGREGITDTAVKTSVSGYLQRRLTKVLEDLSIKYDGTVRNASNSILQITYGNDGLDAEKLVMVNKVPQFVDAKRLASQLNMCYENNLVSSSGSNEGI